MKKITLASFLLITLFAVHGCINHPKGGLSSSNILLYSSTSISEALANDGTFDATIEVTLRGGEFSPSLSDDDFSVIDLPAGMIVALNRISSTRADILITGQVTEEESCGDGTMRFYFENSAFMDNKLPISFEFPIKIQYIRPTLAYSTQLLTEDASNDGSISQTFTITTEGGGTFSQSSGVLDPSNYEWFDLPTGLSSVITVNSATQATVSFTGAAALSTPMSDVRAFLRLSKDALSDNYCAITSKKGFDIEFYRSVIMYALPTAVDGDLDGRNGADVACLAARPTALPDDYNGARAFLSTGPLAVVNLPSQVTMSFDDSVNVESVNSILIATDWSNLFAIDLEDSLATAGVVPAATRFWTGSLADGTADANTCVNWTTNANSSDGQVGSSDAVNEDWLINGSATEECNQLNRLICIAFVRN